MFSHVSHQKHQKELLNLSLVTFLKKKLLKGFEYSLNVATMSLRTQHTALLLRLFTALLPLRCLSCASCTFFYDQKAVEVVESQNRKCSLLEVGHYGWATSLEFEVSAIAAVSARSNEFRGAVIPPNIPLSSHAAPCLVPFPCRWNGWKTRSTSEPRAWWNGKATTTSSSPRPGCRTRGTTPASPATSWPRDAAPPPPWWSTVSRRTSASALYL